jgi:hypothetical protein
MSPGSKRRQATAIGSRRLPDRGRSDDRKPADEHLRAGDRDPPDPDQPRLGAQRQDVAGELGQRGLVALTKPRDRRVIRGLVGTGHTRSINALVVSTGPPPARREPRVVEPLSLVIALEGRPGAPRHRACDARRRPVGDAAGRVSQPAPPAIGADGTYAGRRSNSCGALLGPAPGCSPLRFDAYGSL